LLAENDVDTELLSELSDDENDELFSTIDALLAEVDVANDELTEPNEDENEELFAISVALLAENDVDTEALNTEMSTPSTVPFVVILPITSRAPEI
jgi:hypothetical protein